MVKNKNIKNNKHLGGGAEPKNPLFKPLIATSLALALGVSVAVATDANLSYGQNGSTNSPQTSTITQQITWGNTGASVGGEKIDYVVMQFGDALGTKAPAMSFIPNKSVDTTFGNYNPNSKDKGNYQNKNVFDITYGTSKSTKPYLSFNAGGNAIVLQNGENRGAFVADLGISSQAREMKAVFDGSNSVDGKTYSLQGDFIARSGANATLNVEFQNSIKGNIKTINVIGNDYYQINEDGDPLAFSQNRTLRTFTFKSGATLEGDITGGNLDASGVIQYQNKTWFNDFVDQFVFEDNNVTLQNISYYGGNANLSIKGNGTIQNIQTGWGGYGMGPGWEDLSGLMGNIYIAFEKNDTGENSINKIVSGGGLVDVIFGASRSTTEITSAQGSATSIIKQGAIAKDGSLNIVFATNGASSINAIGDTNGVGNQPDLYQNNDAFRFQSGGASATANITFLGSGENKINGNIMSYGNFGAGKKVLNLTFANGNSSIVGSVRAHGNVVNNIVFKEDVSNSVSIGDILASTTYAGGKGENLISFYGAGKTLSIGSMKVDIGRNTIGKDIEKNMAIDDFMTASHMAGGTLSVTGDIIATNGENLINVNTLNTKNITATAGINAIYANTATFNGDVSITEKARTLITTEGMLNVTGSIIANTGISDTKNNIVLNVGGFNVTQDIKTQGGYGTGIVITTSGTDNTIGGKLLAGGGNSINSNEIILTGNNANLTITGGMGFENGGRNGTLGNQNIITFQNGGTLNVKNSGIVADRSNVTNAITFSGTQGAIKGLIKASSGMNAITFNSSSNTIGADTGGLGGVATTGGGTNKITLNAGSTTISGNIDKNGGTAENPQDISVLTYSNGTNHFVLNNGANLTIGKLYHRYSGKSTIFEINDSNSTLTINNANIDGSAGDGISISFLGDNGTLRFGSESSGTFTAGTLLSGNAVDSAKTNITFANSGTISGTIKTQRSSIINITFNGGGSIDKAGSNGSISTNSGTLNLFFNKTGLSGNSTISEDIFTAGGEANITFGGSGNNTISSFIKNTSGTTNIAFNGGTNQIGDSTNGGGIYVGGGITNITFNGGTNSIQGKIEDEGNSGTSGNKAIITRSGGTANINLNNGATLNVGNIYTRTYDNGYTNFNISNGASNLTIDSLTSYSSTTFTFDNNSGGSTTTFSNGVSLDYGGVVNFVMGKNNDSKATTQQQIVVKGNLSYGSDDPIVSGVESVYGIQKYTFDGDNFSLTLKANDIQRTISLSNAKHKSVTTFNGKNNILDTSFDVTAGTNEIAINDNASGTITGSINTSGSGNTTATFSGTSSLTLQGTTNTFTSIVASATPAENRSTPISTLILDGSRENTTSTATITNGENLIVHFGVDNNAKTFRLTGQNPVGGANIEQKIKTITFDDSSLNNTLDLTATNQKLTITDSVSLVDGQKLTFSLKNSELNFGGDSLGLSGGNTIFSVGDSGANGTATISGGDIAVSTLEMTASASQTSSITFKNTTSTFDNLVAVKNSGGTNTYNLTLGEGSSKVTFKNAGSIAQGSITSATLDSVTFSGTSGEQTLEFGGGNAVLSSITASNNGGKSILQLSSGSTFETANSTNVSASGTNNLHILFTGGTDDQIHLSTLTLTGNNNSLASVTSEAKNAVIKLDGTSGNAGVTIGGDDGIVIGNGNSLVFSLVSGASSSNATATVTNGITVENGGTFGISIGGGDGTKTISVGTAGQNNNTITFADNSTLLIDFLDGAKGNVTLGTSLNDNSNGNKVVIGTNRNSIINFHGNNNGASVNGGIKIAGGNNTINFLGSASLENIEFSSGDNTINVRDNESGTGVIATIVLDSGSGSQLGNMTNTINLENNATLDLQQTSNNSGTGTLVANNTNKPSTLNFIGNNATFKGGLNATGGKATINVGYVNTKNDSLQGVQISDTIKGTITGQVTNADVVFNANKSQLILKGGENTFNSLQTKATDGILTLDATDNNVKATVSGNIAIEDGKSLTFELNSTNTKSDGSSPANFKAEAEITGNITVKNGGTLGIAIGGNGTGVRNVTMGGGTPTLEAGSTLRVDFLAGSQGSATLGGSKQFEIGKDETTGVKSKSIINFYTGSNATLNGGGLKLTGGDNTANFYGSATLGGIELESGTNTINVKSGTNTAPITATLLTGTLGGSKVVTTLNLEDYAIVDLKSGDNNNSGSSGSGSLTASVNAKGVGTLIKGNLTNSSITFTTSNADLTLQGVSNTITTLTGYTPAVASYVRNGRVISTSSQNILTLDATTASGASVTIAQAITGNSVALKFGNGNNSKTFTLSEGGNTLSGVLFGNTSTNNILAFTKGANVITDEMDIATDNGLTIALENGSSATPTSLDFSGGFNKNSGGTANLSVKGVANVSGEAIAISSLSFDAQNSYLAIQNANATFDTLTASNASTLSLDGSNNAIITTISKLNGDNLTADFNGNGTNSTMLKIENSNDTNKTITLSGITVASASTNNTLDLSSLTKATISNEVEIIGSEDARKELTINLKDTELELARGLSTENATTTINVSDVTNGGATLSGGNAVVTNLNMSGTGALQTTFKNSSTTIDNLSASGSTSNAIALDATGYNVSTTINNAIIGNNLAVTFKGNATNKAELKLNNADNQDSTLKSITLSESSSDATHNVLSLTNGKTTITESLSIESGKGLGINLSGTTELVNSTITNAGALAIDIKDSANATITGAITTNSGTTTLTLGDNANAVISGTLGGSGNNNVTFQASSSNEEGTITSNSLTLGGGNNTINTLKAEDSSNAYLKGADATINTITLGNGKSANLTLMNTNSTITTLSGKGMLSIDATSNAVTAKINNNVNSGSDLTLNFNGQGSSKQASLTLGDGGSFKTLTASSGSTGNTLALGANTTSFSDKVELENGVDMTFNLSNNTTLALNGGLIGGTTTLAVTSNGTANSATLSGKATGDEIANIALSNVNLSGNNASALTLKAQSITIDTLSATATTSNTLKLDDSENAVNAVIQQNLSGDALALNFNGASKGATLTLNGSTNTIKSVSVEGGSNLNTLSLTKGTTTINDATTISNGALNIDLGSGSKLIATNDFTTSGGVSTFNLNDATLQAKGTNGIKASGGITNINFLQGASSIIGSGLKVENGGTLNLNVSSNAIANFNTLSNAGTANLSFKGSDGVLYFTPTSSSNATLTLSSISSEGGNNIVDIASNKINGEFTIISDRKDFRILKVGSANSNEATIKGQNIGFKLFVDKNQEGTSSIGGDAIGNNGQSTNYGYAYSDRIIINSKSDTSSTHTLYIVPKIDELSKIAYNGGGTEVANNVAVATIKKGSGITLGTEKVLNGFEVIQAELIPVDTDENGKVVNKGTGDYTTYFLGKVTSVGTSIETQEVASTALSINYDLYMANLNSLNKRMGELRDNSHNQGVWARVFGGAQSSSFGIGSDTEYVTVQAGYDYDFDFSNAKNYLGVALSYATSTSKSLSATQNIVNANASSSNVAGIDNINSNAYEVAVYNAYVSDSGWYNDTIAKFSYINSTFSLTNSANESSTTNMAFTLSDEVGYRYKFAENEKGNWYIDPQLELAFGYLNQSDFNSVIASTSTSGFSNLNAFQDAVMTLRTRIGASLGKKFNTDKGFASLYVGAFYEYDYVAGGDSDIGVESGATNTLSPLSSSGRAVLNVGSNIELTKGARLYIDVEKSFGDKFRTHMQFNVGTRYSF